VQFHSSLTVNHSVSAQGTSKEDDEHGFREKVSPNLGDVRPDPKES
jgi:hypothetical protein